MLRNNLEDVADAKEQGEEVMSSYDTETEFLTFQ